MTALRLLAVLLLPLLAAADDMSDYRDRLKKLELDELGRRAALAKHCEGAKMWKDALVELKRCVALAPDLPDFAERFKAAEQKADVSESRPTKSQIDAYKAGLAALGRDLGKRYWEVAEFAREKTLYLQAEASGELAAAMDASAGAKSERAEKFWAELYPPEDERRRAVEALNAYRKACKLAPVYLSPLLTDGAQKHAEFLVTNVGHPTTEGLGAHNEDSSLPGYTPEGERAGKSSDIGFTQPIASMIGMIGTFYHRIPLLNPGLRKVGVGFKPHADSTFGPVVIDCLSGVDRLPPQAIAFPPPAYPNAQRAFDDELPDPIPPGEDKDNGTAVTVTWFGSRKIENVKFELAKKGGKPLVGFLSTPQAPARADHGNGSTMCFIPDEYLEAKSVYAASVTATVDGKNFTLKWEFTTGEQESDEMKVLGR